VNGLRLPHGLGRKALSAAVVTWCGAMGGWTWGFPAILIGGILGLAAAATRRWLAGALLAASIVSGWAAAARVDATLGAAVSEGAIVLAGRVVDEPVREDSGLRFVFVGEHRLDLGAWHAAATPPIAVSSRDGQYRPTAGDRVMVRGSLRSAPGRVRGDPVAGRISRASVELMAASDNPLFTIGNLLRRRVGSELIEKENRDAAALLSGFLIGDTSGLGPRDTEALRLAGLSHFVAVSGSNVALFLAGWWLVTAPIARRPKVRAAIGLVGLAVFVVVTRWEPSVVRAAVMAGLVLGGRLLGAPIDAWTALGTAAAALLLVSGDLATSVGFQLSVFATAGVLAGAGLFAGRRPGWAWTALAATVSAQVAVMPLLLIHFGTVPLLSPVANMVAAPLVTLATVLGGTGVGIGWGWVVDPALWAAGAVLRIAHLAAGWPQLGVEGVAGVAALAGLARWKSMRLPVAAVSVAALVVITAPGTVPGHPTVTFLDVGQGDAVLLQDGRGVTVLVDAGREPRVLDAALRRHGVRRLDLLVVTHGDADHAGGLEGMVGRTAIGRIWVPDQRDLGPILPSFLAAAQDRQIPVEHLRSGPRVDVGDFTITVLGPTRRYKSINDGSIVLWVEAADRSVLLAGDIERVAQRDLGPLRPDVLLVPHHGSSTTDIEWLVDVVGADAVVSVGENTYGHPSTQVMEALRSAGARIWVTQHAGDISLPLG
jgi:competence protein ComEC